MQQFTPLELFSYFLVFQCHFSKPNFVYFQGYLWGLLLARGRKTMNNVAHCCFWVERSLSSWERFLSENLWDVNAVVKTLVTLLLQKLENKLQVHGGYLAGLDTLLLAKNGQNMSLRLKHSRSKFMANRFKLKPSNEKFLFADFSPKSKSLSLKARKNRLFFSQLS